jgi:hypothetical protein
MIASRTMASDAENWVIWSSSYLDIDWTIWSFNLKINDQITR